MSFSIPSQSGGGLMQLNLPGCDLYMYGNPEMTFFKTNVQRFQNFSMEARTDLDFDRYNSDTIFQYGLEKEPLEKFKPMRKSFSSTDSQVKTYDNPQPLLSSLIGITFEDNQKEYNAERRNKLNKDLIEITDAQKMNIPTDLINLIASFIY